MNRSRGYLIRLLIILCVLVGTWQIAEGGYIKAKAWLAQQLLQSAWDTTLTGGERTYPWPWADTWPVARLRVKRLGIDQIVLSGASGRNLAFGPGHIAGTAAPGESGNVVLSGHRDTHFRFLRDLQPGDWIELTPANGRSLIYAVIRREVHSQDDVWLLNQDASRLTLITCYPFDALIPGGRERFVIRAEPVRPIAQAAKADIYM
ncbi:class GN sortase [Sedimenticola sp.]|uniref:class GN sortase n=1 Tax=Sedimenticola sp. TaxID=1940285 RepID=UPI003D0F30B7